MPQYFQNQSYLLPMKIPGKSISYMQSFDNNNMNEIYAPLGLHMAILGFNNALKHIDNT